MYRKIAVAMALALMVGVSAFAADDAGQSAENAYQEMAQIEQEMYAKQMELAEVMNSAAPDAAKVEQLYAAIGALRGKMAVAGMELDSQYGNNAMPYGRGYGYCGGMGMGMGRGMGYGHRGGMGMGRGMGYGHRGGGYGGGHHGGHGW